MSEENCGNCRFWKVGRCRKNPPSAMLPLSASAARSEHDEWCGEWRSKDATGTTGKLYQLPNGQWITPSMVSAVAVYVDPRSPFVAVCFRDGGGQHEIDCQTKEAAEAMRDKIAADVNAMVGGA